MAVDQNLFFARRLGFGLAPGENLPVPPRDWAMEQVRSIPPLDFIGKDGASVFDQLKAPVELDGLIRSNDPSVLKPFADFSEACKMWERYRATFDKLMAAGKKMPPDQYDRLEYEEIVYPYMFIPRWRDCLRKTLTAVNGKSPVFERFWMFWNNHFTVSTTEAEIKLYYGPHITNIRRRMTGSFADMLFDAIANPAMLLYLSNDMSVGPHSRKAHDPNADNRDLNENLGRELLELHTVSPAAGYSQKDVTEAAMIFTGWQQYAGPATQGKLPASVPYGAYFFAPAHEPGPHTVMGKTYKPRGKGDNQLHDLIGDLAVHPETVKHLSLKLARHFIADAPPQDCVDRIARKFAESSGDLVAIHSAVIDEVLALATTYPKLTTPENWLVQAYKLSGADIPLSPPRGGSELISWVFKELGQSFDECPQPNGWSDRKGDWLSKEMLDRRVREAYRIGTASAAFSNDELADYASRLAGADSPLVLLVRRAELRGVAFGLLMASPQFLKM